MAAPLLRVRRPVWGVGEELGAGVGDIEVAHGELADAVAAS
jgi:hypothetical protein